MNLDAMNEFFEPPQITEHLGVAAWIFCSVGAVLGIMLIAGSWLVSPYSRKLIAGIGSTVGGGLLACCLFIMLRAVAPGLGWSWWLLVGSVLVLITGISYALWRLSRDSAPVWGTFLCSGAALILAILLDKLNEYMGGIPLAWGTVLVVIAAGAGVAIWAQQER